MVIFEDAIGEPVGTKVLPDVFDRVKSGRTRGQKDWRDVLGHVEVGCCVPSGPVENPFARALLMAWRESPSRPVNQNSNFRGIPT